MSRGRMPSPGVPGARDFRAVWLGFWLLSPALLVLFASLGCQEADLLEPGDVTSNIIRAVYIPPEEFLENTIELDGQALEREWGAALDPTRAYTQIRCTAEDGAGFPGDPKYVAMKAVYTDRDLFLLLRWTDARPDENKDALFYVGPDIPASRPDSLRCWAPLMDPANWIQEFSAREWEEDRLVLAFQMEAAGDNLGTYAEQGCRVACHPGASPQFGRPGYGRLDVWQWMSTRTNFHRNLYLPTDNPNFPRFGIPAYLDDYSIDPVSGLVPDPGRPGWVRNWDQGTGVPLYVYRPLDDRFSNPPDPNSCFNSFGEKCRANNGLPIYYIWREDLDAAVPQFTACDTVNHAVLPQGQEARRWEYGDAVTGYYYSYPDGSRANVRGRAVYGNGIWTLEVARPLNTNDPFNDVIFTGEPGSEVVFTVAVMDNSSTVHWGSGPQILRFGPKVATAKGVDQSAGEEVQ